MRPIATSFEQWVRNTERDVRRLQRTPTPPPASGRTVARPPGEDLPAGWHYFDTDLGKPVWWDGTGWVDALGRSADAAVVLAPLNGFSTTGTLSI